MTYKATSNKDIKWLRFTVEGASIFSTCSKMQYMAIIVNSAGIIDSTGYNGVPSGFKHCNEGGCPRFLNDVPSGTPYDSGPGLCYAIHAEINCLIHSDVSNRQGGTLYVNGGPCFGCSKTIANSGLARVVYLGEPFRLDVDNASEVLKQSKLEVLTYTMNDLRAG